MRYQNMSDFIKLRHTQIDITSAACCRNCLMKTVFAKNQIKKNYQHFWLPSGSNEPNYKHLHYLGRPKKKWLDNIQEDCEDINMSIVQASHLSWEWTNEQNTVLTTSSVGARGQRHCRQGHKSSKSTLFIILFTCILKCIIILFYSLYRCFHGQARYGHTCTYFWVQCSTNAQ